MDGARSIVLEWNGLDGCAHRACDLDGSSALLITHPYRLLDCSDSNHSYPFPLSAAEIRTELSNQLVREREVREHVEKQFHDEQKIRSKYLSCRCVRPSQFTHTTPLLFSSYLSKTLQKGTQTPSQTGARIAARFRIAATIAPTGQAGDQLGPPTITIQQWRGAQFPATTAAAAGFVHQQCERDPEVVTRSNAAPHPATQHCIVGWGRVLGPCWPPPTQTSDKPIGWPRAHRRWVCYSESQLDPGPTHPHDHVTPFVYINLL